MHPTNFDVKVKIGETLYLVSLECEENKNVPQGNYAKRSSKSHWNNKNVNQTNDDVKVVHLYNIKEKKKIVDVTSFNQSAYHGTRVKGLENTGFDLSYSLSGEGANAQKEWEEKVNKVKFNLH